MSPETNQSLVSGMRHITRNSSRTWSNSLRCRTNPKVRAGDLKLKIFLLSPRPPASHGSPADEEDSDFASGRRSILLNDDSESLVRVKYLPSTNHMCLQEAHSASLTVGFTFASLT